jgi:hypothetical protein
MVPDLRELLAKIRTPSEITPPIRLLCEQVTGSDLPFYVESRTRLGAVFQECFSNVAAEVAASGGSILHGWQIQEWPGILVQAEFHAVWVSLVEGQYLDVSPQSGILQRILFLPDPSRVYDGERVATVYLPLTRDRLARDMITGLRRTYEMQNRGARARQDQVLLTADEQREVAHFGGLLVAVAMGNTAPDPCVCGSQRRYVDCCATK